VSNVAAAGVLEGSLEITSGPVPSGLSAEFAGLSAPSFVQDAVKRNKAMARIENAFIDYVFCLPGLKQDATSQSTQKCDIFQQNHSIWHPLINYLNRLDALK
jgi:hypothetical protein